MGFCWPAAVQVLHTDVSALQQVSIYADVSQDDSYTPQKISLRAGTYHGDLHEVRWVDLQQPNGWQHLQIGGGTRGEEG